MPSTFLRASLSLASNQESSSLVTTRFLDRDAQVVLQTIAICGRRITFVSGTHQRGKMESGRDIELVLADELGPGDLRSPVWDATNGGAVYSLIEDGRFVVRLAASAGDEGFATVISGSVGDEEGQRDGPAGFARFRSLRHMVGDGAGALYVTHLETQHTMVIRKLKLPPASEPSGDVWTTTLPLQLPARTYALAFDGSRAGGGGHIGGGSLIFATATAIYRVPLDRCDADTAPVLLAGVEGMFGEVDGAIVDSRFYSINGLTVDGDGNVYVLDFDQTVTCLRRVGVDGSVTTLAEVAVGDCWRPIVLPNGNLAVCGDDGVMHVLDLDLTPPHWQATAPPVCSPVAKPAPGPPPRTLPADLGALLDRQPDGTADVTIVVSGRTFHAHRGVLSARSDYFRQLFGSDFADGAAAQHTLEDADAAAFDATLHYIYQGTAEFAPAQTQAVADLAGRLLLPELCRLASEQLAAGVSAGSVVGLLLWADARGPAFLELISRLKGWYVQHHEEVVDEAPESIRRLAAANPTMMVELMMQLGSPRPTKRTRLG
ncbi:Kelch repeat and BTB domain-containing protein 4 [Tetrabaena socialis]|uniref:Kelch repeat and BTB domain-containing protein 4 n=1 Tax=Tetrabaena socialis TaxID=47790 RepID=A0A2J8A4I0_9CHLO|nr:Kelch repeat and BTB domain-containing protein 4 [Tetrabaena socialis]|eukprot:PNH07417.1 Kelch repeat and BTB domain-containing protein 4 [Tetrabaena socialis]